MCFFANFFDHLGRRLWFFLAIPPPQKNHPNVQLMRSNQHLRRFQPHPGRPTLVAFVSSAWLLTWWIGPQLHHSLWCETVEVVGSKYVLRFGGFLGAEVRVCVSVAFLQKGKKWGASYEPREDKTGLSIYVKVDTSCLHTGKNGARGEIQKIDKHSGNSVPSAN